MKTKSLPYLIVASIAAVLFFTSFQKEVVHLCKNGKAISRIVIPSDPTEVEKHASVVLQNYLHQITGAGFEIVSDDTPARKNDIQIGRVNRLEIAELDFAELEEDGYVISTQNGRLNIAGARNVRKPISWQNCCGILSRIWMPSWNFLK
jgi:hypothetical protein